MQCPRTRGGSADDHRLRLRLRRARTGFRRPRPVRVQAGAEALARAGQLVRGRVQLHLALDRHLHPVRAGPDHDRRGVHLDLAGGGGGPVPGRAQLRRGVQPLPGGGVGVPVDQVPGQPDVFVVHRLDLPVRRHPDRHRGGRDHADRAHSRPQRPGLAQPERGQPAYPARGRADHPGHHHRAEHLRGAAGRGDQQHRGGVRDPRHVRVRDRAADLPQPPGLQRGHQQRRPARRCRTRSWPPCS